MRARPDIDPGADGLDDARALVTKHRRAPGGRGAVDRVEVAVADTAGMQPHQNLSGMRRGQFELAHIHGSAGFRQHCRRDPHQVSLTATEVAALGGGRVRKKDFSERALVGLIRSRFVNPTAASASSNPARLPITTTS